MDVQYLIDIFEIESRSLDVLLRQHLLLRPLFTRSFRGVETSARTHIVPVSTIGGRLACIVCRRC